MSKKSNKASVLYSDFKKFISRGNVIDMAVGVIMGSAFGAIVTSMVNVLLTLCTWGIPGGLTGLVTVLPALNASQIAPEGMKNIYTSVEWFDSSMDAVRGSYASSYTQHGASYYYKTLPVIDWGALITAVINFLIIALVLFTILKIVSFLSNRRKEALYTLHPELRPVPPIPGVPVDSAEVVILKEIRDELKANKK